MSSFSELQVKARKKILEQELKNFEAKVTPNRLARMNESIETIMSNDLWNTVGGINFMTKLNSATTEIDGNAKYIQENTYQMRTATVEYHINTNRTNIQILNQDSNGNI